MLDYRCAACGRVFNAFTGTALQATKRRPVELVLILRGVAQGVPTARLARELGCQTARQACSGSATGSSTGLAVPRSVALWGTRWRRSTRCTRTRGKRCAAHRPRRSAAAAREPGPRARHLVHERAPRRYRAARVARSSPTGSPRCAPYGRRRRRGAACRPGSRRPRGRSSRPRNSATSASSNSLPPARLAVSTSHRRMLLSAQPAASRRPSGLKATPWPRLSCGRIASTSCVAEFHSRTVLSRQAAASRRPSGLYARLKTHFFAAAQHRPGRSGLHGPEERHCPVHARRGQLRAVGTERHVQHKILVPAQHGDRLIPGRVPRAQCAVAAPTARQFPWGWKAARGYPPPSVAPRHPRGGFAPSLPWRRP